MITEYIQAAMEKTTYEIINDEEPYFAKTPELQGVWASWKKSLPIPPIEKYKIEVPTEIETSA